MQITGHSTWSTAPTSNKSTQASTPASSDTVPTSTDSNHFDPGTESSTSSSAPVTLSPKQEIMNSFLEKGVDKGLWSEEQAKTAKLDPNFEQAYDIAKTAIKSWEYANLNRYDALMPHKLHFVFRYEADKYSDAVRDILKAHLLNHENVSENAKFFFSYQIGNKKRPTQPIASSSASASSSSSSSSSSSQSSASPLKPSSTVAQSVPAKESAPPSDEAVAKEVDKLVHYYSDENMGFSKAIRFAEDGIKAILGPDSRVSPHAQSKARTAFELFAKSRAIAAPSIGNALARYPQKGVQTPVSSSSSSSSSSSTSVSSVSTHTVSSQPFDDAAHQVLAKLVKYHYGQGVQNIEGDQTARQAAQIIFGGGEVSSATPATQKQLRGYLGIFGRNSDVGRALEAYPEKGVESSSSLLSMPSSSSSSASSFSSGALLSTSSPLLSSVSTQSASRHQDIDAYRLVASFVSSVRKATKENDRNTMAAQTVNEIFGPESRFSAKAKATVRLIFEDYAKNQPTIKTGIETTETFSYLAAKK